MTKPLLLIETLALEPHPEGGWYRETWRAPCQEDGRALATAIYYLLENGQSSHWHKVDAAEIWLWHAGSPLSMELAESEDGPVEPITLGPDVDGGDRPQLVIAPGWWQAADADSGWALVSCVVSPGFEFSGFEMAPQGWQPGLKNGN